MTRVSFYILNSEDPNHRYQFACRLAEKAYHQGHQVMIHTESAEQTALMDELLWSFRADSFVPHQVLQKETEVEAPVLISESPEAPPKLMDVLINLNSTHPMFFSQFERMAEIVDDDEQIKQQGRQRYQFYKDRGYQLDTHKIKV